MLILHLVCYLSGECSFKKAISLLLEYVSKSLFFVLCLLMIIRHLIWPTLPGTKAILP